MNGPRRYSGCAIVSVVLVSGFLAACSDFSLYDRFSSLISLEDISDGSVTPLLIEPVTSGTLVGKTLYFSASGGTPPYRFAVLAGGAGGSVLSASGVYTAPGTTTGIDSVQVSDARGQIANASVAVVGAPVLQISPSALQLNAGDTYVFSATGGVPPYSFSLESGGQSITSAGELTAPLTAPASSTVKVTDKVGAAATGAVTTVAAGGGGALTLSPATVSISTNETLYLVASGGIPPYNTPTSPNGTIGQVDATTYTYVADPKNLEKNTLTLTDGGGGSATAVVTVYPAAPSSLSAEPTSSQSIALSWTNNIAASSVSGIDVYRAKGTGGFTKITTSGLLAGDTETYSDTGLSSGSVYVYKVVVVKNGSYGIITGTSNYVVETTP